MSSDLELGSLSRGGAGAPRYELASAREDGDDAPIAFEVRVQRCVGPGSHCSS